MTQDAFEVSLNFSRRAERLTVPFDAITGFTDPSVPFGFKLEPRAPGEPAAADPAPAPTAQREPKSVPAPAAKSERAPAVASKPATSENGTERPVAAKVVSIDAFRKK